MAGQGLQILSTDLDLLLKKGVNTLNHVLRNVNFIAELQKNIRQTSSGDNLLEIFANSAPCTNNSEDSSSQRKRIHLSALSKMDG